MFESTLVESTQGKRDSRTAFFFVATSAIWTLSLIGAIVGGILFYDAKLDEQMQMLTMLAPPPPPPPPPPPASSAPKTVVKTAPTLSINMAVKEAPKEIPKPTSLAKVETNTGNLDVGVEGGVEGGVAGGVAGGVVGGVIGGTGPAAEPPPPPPDPAPDPPKADPPPPSIVRRSEGVIRGNALDKPSPDYPQLAKTAHVEGDVVVEITIGEDGNVSGARVISGHPLLQASALSAAKRWKFKPTLLNNTAVKVSGVLTFRFKLS